MRTYDNLGGASSVISYESADGFITVTLKDGWTYEYSDTATGKDNVIRMQQLAAAGRGLESYIHTTVKRQFARRWR